MQLDAIKAGKCDTFDGLTYSSVARYCPKANKTILEHLAQQHPNVRLTKPKLPTPLSPSALPTTAPSPTDVPSNQVFVMVYPLSRLYTDATGRFPVRSHLENQYIMIAFHTDGSLILQQAFKSKSNCHCIAAYNANMTRLAARGLLADIQKLDNKASAAYKEAITFQWNAKFHLVPPIVKTGLNALFARSRITSWQYWPASTPHFPCTFKTCFCHRLNSPSIFSAKPHSIRRLARGIFPRAL
jgi:hypothetical protein